jgi:hypothetical protein
VVVGDFNTPLSPIDRSSRQKKKNQQILELKNTIDLTDLTDVYRIFHPCNSTIYILLISQWNVLQNRSHPRAQSKSQQIKEIEISPCILSDHSKTRTTAKAAAKYTQTTGG